MSSQSRSDKSFSYFAYINLTISSSGTIYRAYVNDDIPMVVFILFYIIAFCVSEMCMRALNRLPQNEDSLKKFILKVTNWVLVSAILFGFAYQFGTFVCVTAAVIIFSAVIAASAFLFFVYFIYDDAKKINTSTTSGNSYDNNGEKISLFTANSCTEGDKVATSILEKV
ncbi:hypothetical protein PanWU01x14_159830 [Parasponia andersonii]|uniref:Uncharacterized protein n=1 Tax=Parasponia andersonii TaxID=3476 RepID=A0A2P5CEI1_PARAD|nr:hypothetical protein PanWU01x14_159830 [Parasponia andersonii]